MVESKPDIGRIRGNEQCRLVVSLVTNARNSTMSRLASFTSLDFTPSSWPSNCPRWALR